MENERWASSRRPFDDAARQELRDLLSRGGDRPPDPGDEIPHGYLEWAARNLAPQQVDEKSL